MARRKRKYIPYNQRLAAALACLIPQMRRDELRHDHATAKYVISLFTFDHLHLHSLNGSDKWWNLDPKIRGPELNLKNASDTTLAAKVKRLKDDHEDFRKRVLRPVKRRKAKRVRKRPVWDRRGWRRNDRILQRS